MGHLRALHAELVGILDESSESAATDKIKVSGAGGARAAKRDLRLIEILRAISELVRETETQKHNKSVSPVTQDKQSASTYL